MHTYIYIHTSIHINVNTNTCAYESFNEFSFLLAEIHTYMNTYIYDVKSPTDSSFIFTFVCIHVF